MSSDGGCKYEDDDNGDFDEDDVDEDDNEHLRKKLSATSRSQKCNASREVSASVFQYFSI